MNLTDLLKEIKDENIPKTKLEHYHSLLTSFYAETHLRMAELEKMESLYFLAAKKTNDTLSDVGIKRLFRGTPEGQELIQRDHEAKALEKMLSSVRNRIFASMY